MAGQVKRLLDMQWSQVYEVKSFKFCFIDAGQFDSGVIVHPSADLSDPAYLDALKEAISLWPAINAANWIDDYLVAFRYNAAWHYTPEYLSECIDVLANERRLEIKPGFLEEARLLLNESYVERQRRQLKQEKPFKNPAKRNGYVYLIRSAMGHYKIGRTSDPENRMKTFTVRLPFEIEYVCVIKSEDMKALEGELHQRFEQKRVNGEWFALDADDVEYIRGLAS